MIYLLTAIGLTPGGSSTVHIYTQTIHRTTQITTKQHKNCPSEFGPPLLVTLPGIYVLPARLMGHNYKAFFGRGGIYPFLFITFLLFPFFIITNKSQSITQQPVCVTYTATCFDTFLSPSDSLQPMSC
jgi:hypothetical protein